MHMTRPQQLIDHPAVQDQAALSYANREFDDAVQTLNELVQRQSDNPRWYEMRAQVCC